MVRERDKLRHTRPTKTHNKQTTSRLLWMGSYLVVDIHPIDLSVPFGGFAIPARSGEPDIF